MKFTLNTLQNGGTKVLEKECSEWDLFNEIKKALQEYDSEKHDFDIEYVNILSDNGKRLVHAQNRCTGGYMFCCWSFTKRNTVNKAWQRKFNEAFNRSGAFMNW